MVSPARRRDAARYLQKRHHVSERRACSLVGQHRSTQRYRKVAPDFELRLVKRMNQIAEAHPRYGYRMVCSLLRAEGWVINRKRIERLWRLEGHKVPPMRHKDSGNKALGGAANSSRNRPATRPNHIWSYDFVMTRTRRGGPIKIMNVVDEFTRVSLGCRVDRSIGARDVAQELDRLFEQHGKPEVIRSDNGAEFVAATVRDRLSYHGVTPAFIQKGSPQQNPFVERFNGTMRNELLNAEEFDSVLEARVVIDAWRAEYNGLRPHRGLGMLTPNQFARVWKDGSR